jgi:di/tricarboxylate transporter
VQDVSTVPLQAANGATLSPLTPPALAYSARTITAIILYLVGLALILAPLFLEIADQSWRGGGLALILVGLFASGIKDHVAAIVFFSTAAAIAAIPPNIAFSGFLSQGTWIVFSGMMIAAAMKDLGLADRLAAMLLPSHPPHYAIAVLAVGFLSLLLALLVPSTAARVLLLAPIAASYAGQLGYSTKSSATLGLVIAGAVSTYLFGGGILTAALTNVAMASLAQELLNVQITYQEYLVCAFPVLSFCTFVLLTGVIPLVFGGRAEARAGADEKRARKPVAAMSGDSRILALILGATVILWCTDSVHGISASWVGLAAAGLILCGPGRKLALSQCVKIEVWIVFAALLSLGAILEHTEATDTLGHWLIANIPLHPGSDWLNLAVITAVGSALSLAGTNLAAPVLYTSLAEPIAQSTGWPIKTVLLVGIPSWTYVPFLFQAPILLVCVRMLGLSVRNVAVFTFGFSILAMSTLVPLHFVWLRHLGYFAPAQAAFPAQPLQQPARAVTPLSRGPVPQSVSDVAQPPTEALPRTFSGWLYWRCWDDSQAIILRLDEPSIERDGLIRASGTEYYHIDGFYHSISVSVEIAPDSGSFIMREDDPARAGESDVSVDDSYQGRISSDFRAIETRPGGCSPEMTLTAVDETRGEPLEAVIVEVKQSPQEFHHSPKE